VSAFIEFSIPSSTLRYNGKTGGSYTGHGNKEKRWLLTGAELSRD
jgi:hypothetical protein